MSFYLKFKYKFTALASCQLLRFASKKVVSSEEPTMRVLNVAEKNDAAKNIAAFLSGNNVARREGKSKYNKIYEFNYRFNGQNAKMVMTSVSGHLLNYAFVGQYKKWTSCSPESLFDAPVVKQCPDDYKDIRETLVREIRTCDVLVIWTDCDREGENIGFEIIKVCKEVKANIQVYRAKFSEITQESIRRAMATLIQPNELISKAVDVRSELDLRIGASFTRFQTLRLQRVFPTILAEHLISYGSCQFPTLGFVVERYKAVENFIPEKFWKLKVLHKKDDLVVEFVWKRVRLFDELFCQVLYERCHENLLAKVENVVTKPKSKYRPVPLDTIELEKTASRKLKINAKETMRIAERLYSQGFISYPRTETNIFPKEMDLPGLVQLQVNDNRWGTFANNLLQEGPNPRQGKKSDQAHPPIHPTRHADKLTGNDAKVYEYIVRHFLACLSKNAEGYETIVSIDVNDEKFVASGLQIIAKNYLEVYPYEKWNSKEIHAYELGQTFVPTSLDMVDGETSPPNLLTEADLISLMEKHGIGTDATHAEHIETIKQRMYVGLQDNIYFVPGELGIGLVEGYDSMGFQMSKPHLRAELEADLKRICEGQKDHRLVLTEQVNKYRDVFKQAVRQADKIDSALNKYLRAEVAPVSNDLNALVDLPEYVMKCSSCQCGMILKHRPNNTSFISCTGFPECKNSIWLPQKVLQVELVADTCVECGPNVRLLRFKFEPSSMAPFYPSVYTGCIGGCDDQFLEMLGVRSQTNNRGDNVTNNRTNPPRNTFNNSSTTSTSTFNQNRNNNTQYGDSGLGSSSSNFSTFNQNRNNNTQFGNNDSSGSTFRGNSFSSQQRPNTANRNTFNQGSQDDGNNDVQCNCGQPARKFTVMKESVNKGRPFFVCSKPQGDSGRCDFFMWADGLQQSGSASGGSGFNSMGNQNTRYNNSRGGGFGNQNSNFNNVDYHNSGNNNRRGGFGNQSRGRGNRSFRARKTTVNGRLATTRKCGHCREQGHTRNNCPLLDADDDFD